MAPIGIAILGSGIFVREEHKPAVDANKDFELKAVYSRSKASAQLLLEGTSGVDIYSDDSGAGKDIDALLARSDIQAVVIALPILNQPSFIKKSLLAGKHVLSEKPITKDLASARELISWRKSHIPQSTLWSVAENFRFLETWRYARSTVESLGRVLGFSAEMQCMVHPGGKYYETEWRKKPSYQGGFLLDGGVHFTAALHLLLGSDGVERVSAFTAQNQVHLPPVDTVSAVVRTKSGVVGRFALSFGTTFESFEFSVACEKGTVTVGRGSKVVVKKVGGETETKEFPGDKSGVVQELKAFGEALVKGVADERQTPELALADLELLEKMLQSGEQHGASLSITGGL